MSTTQQTKKSVNYAFIDSQNLNLGVQSVRLDLPRNKLEYTGLKNKPALAVGRNLRPAWNGDTL